MKRNFFLLIAAVILLTIVTMIVNDGWVYAIAALMVTTVVAVIRSFSSRVLRITRWAKANPRKTQVLIGVLQILVICAALLIGYDLKELGYQLNESVSIIFGVILVLAFFSIRFLPRQNTVAIPAAVNKDRMAYMAIVLSAFVVMVVTGNRIEDKFPNSPISAALKSVDASIFGAGESDILSFKANTNENATLLAFTSVSVDEETISPDIHPEKEVKENIKPSKKAEKLEKKKKKMMKRVERLRKMMGAGATVGTVLLIILLVITSCAGICLIAIGGSVGAVLLGIVLLAGSVFGFVKLFQKKNRTKEA